jgi:hypothetical protein
MEKQRTEICSRVAKKIYRAESLKINTQNTNKQKWIISLHSCRPISVSELMFYYYAIKFHSIIASSSTL